MTWVAHFQWQGIGGRIVTEGEPSCSFGVVGWNLEYRPGSAAASCRRSRRGAGRAWAAARRSLAVINREDRETVEGEVSTSIQGWQAKRIALQGRPGTLQVDEHGHVLSDQPWKASKVARAAGPLTPPGGAKQPGKSTPGAAKSIPPAKGRPYPGYNPYGPRQDRGRGPER